MAIHHAQQKSAESMGYTLEEVDNGLVRAFMASVGQQIFGVSAKDAMNQMIAFQNILKRDPEIRFQPSTPPTLGQLRRTDNDFLTRGTATTPVELYRNYDKLIWQKVEPIEEEPVHHVADADISTEDGPEPEPFEETPKPPVEDTPVIKRSEKGVALDGATAYKEGIMAADNPFDEGTEEGDAWDAQWDQAADEAPDPADKKGGSVVASRYRTKYKEQGHPTHSGDWLAILLNNFCVGKKETDLAMFERICGLNGVDTSKYNRTTPGWQGRVRMTGRNLLARQIFTTKHIIVPGDGADGTMEIAAPADWLSAQRFAQPKGE
jgi:hypothetical protein